VLVPSWLLENQEISMHTGPLVGMKFMCISSLIVVEWVIFSAYYLVKFVLYVSSIELFDWH
jgi:hypothetical protein